MDEISYKDSSESLKCQVLLLVYWRRELAKHLIERFSLKDVKVEVTELGDPYT